MRTFECVRERGSNGANYPNESVFREILPDARIVIAHVVKPLFTLTVTLTAQGDQTHLSWVQEFESSEFAERMRPLSETANKQNLDRLEALLAKTLSPRAALRHCIRLALTYRKSTAASRSPA